MCSHGSPVPTAVDRFPPGGPVIYGRPPGNRTRIVTGQVFAAEINSPDGIKAFTYWRGHREIIFTAGPAVLIHKKYTRSGSKQNTNNHEHREDCAGNTGH
jgi:hypothetical protein